MRSLVVTVLAVNVCIATLAFTGALGQDEWYKDPKEVRSRAEAGNAYAQSVMGESYLLGEWGFQKDYDQAILWLRKGEQQKHPLALYALGQAYTEGLGVIQNTTAADEYFRSAFTGLLLRASTGDPRWWCNLGCVYRGGKVPKDYKEAVNWLKKAAESGYARAQFSLGICYDQGTGVLKDDKEAVTWYLKSAEQGYAFAQFSLGVCYDQGTGVPQDDAEALRWFQKAAAQGYADASVAIDQIVETRLNATKGNWQEAGKQESTHSPSVADSNIAQNISARPMRSFDWDAVYNQPASNQPSKPHLVFGGAPDDNAKAAYDHPTTPQSTDDSNGGLIMIGLATVAAGGYFLHKKRRELKESRERQRDAEKRCREAEQAAQDERARRETSERAHAEESRRQANERRAEDARQRAEGGNTRSNKEQQRSKSSRKGREFYAHILGLDERFTPEDIKKRYRDLVSQYHPDKVNHLGPKLKEVAEKEMKDINEAYAFFKNNGDIN